jgi:hypothetical protein
MKHLTNEMTRLCHEIGVSHRARRHFIQDLKREVFRMKKANRHAHQVMAKNGKAERIEFVCGVKDAVVNLKKAVSGMRQGFADDIAGARRAWFGKNA